MASTRERYAVTIFFILSVLISSVAVLILQAVATQAGLADFGELIGMAETTFNLRTISSRLVLPVPVVYLLSRVVDFGPSLAGLVTAFVVGGTPELRRLLKKVFQLMASRRAYLAAFLIPTGITIVAFVLHITLGESEALAGANWQGVSTVGWLLFWVFIARTLLGGGLGEEVGWRGFALPRLMEKHGAVRSSLITGVLWAIWHFPAALVADSPVVNMVILLLFVVPQGFTYTWVYNQSKGSLLPVILMHGATNGLSAFMERTLFPPLLEEDNWLIFFILLTLIVGAIMAFLLRKQDAASTEKAT
jgi:membrane protease YdiL (CAAX protease family)